MLLYPLLIVSGRPNSGKDSFISLVSEILEKDYNIKSVCRSSIDTIKDVAKIFGWDGNKNERSREFLSKLKELAIWYNDFPFTEISKFYFSHANKYIVFTQIREPKEIEKFKESLGKMCITILLKSNRNLLCWNYSDFHCEKYGYDIVIENNEDKDSLAQYCKDIFVPCLINYIDNNEKNI